jgi:hypothetical protein
VSKDTIEKMKIHTTESKTILANHVPSIRDLYPGCVKDTHISDLKKKKKDKKSNRKWAKDLNRHSSKEDLHSQQVHEKMFSITFIREIQIKPFHTY